MRRGYFTPPVIIVLALIVFGVAAALYLNLILFSDSKKPENQNQLRAVSTPTPTQSTSLSSNTALKLHPAEITGWNTFKSETFSYEIGFPKEFIIKAKQGPDLLEWIEISSDETFTDFVVVIVIENLNSSSPKEWLSGKRPYVELPEKPNATLDGYQAYRAQRKGTSDFLAYISYYIPKDEYLYTLNFNYDDETFQDKETFSDFALINQILSTFQFLN